MRGLKGKVAVIVGAATGIGKATAIRLAEEGVSVVLGDINIAGVEAVAAQVNATGGKAIDAWDATYKKIKLGRDSLRTLFDTAEVSIAAAQAAQTGTVALTAILTPVKQALRDLAATLTDAGVPAGYSAALLSIAGDK